MSDHFKPVADAASLGTVVATLGGWLPSIAALISIIWGVIRIYETKTVQGWLTRRRSE
jgi:chromate transport protein ChrA